MAIKRHASATWAGTGKEGKGSVTTQSGVLSESPFGFNTRFGDVKGTNPEELLGAAHAGCFSMATAFALTAAGHPPESLRTEATVTLDPDGAGFKISAVHLVMRAKVPGMDSEKFLAVAADAKANCPVSKVLNATITLDAKLEG